MPGYRISFLVNEEDEEPIKHRAIGDETSPTERASSNLQHTSIQLPSTSDQAQRQALQSPRPAQHVQTDTAADAYTQIHIAGHPNDKQLSRGRKLRPTASKHKAPRPFTEDRADIAQQNLDLENPGSQFTPINTASSPTRAISSSSINAQTAVPTSKFQFTKDVKGMNQFCLSQWYYELMSQKQTRNSGAATESPVSTQILFGIEVPGFKIIEPKLNDEDVKKRFKIANSEQLKMPLYECTIEKGKKECSEAKEEGTCLKKEDKKNDGHYMSRKIMSDLFGRNSKEVRALLGLFLVVCRKHYQQSCYQEEQIRAEILKIHTGKSKRHGPTPDLCTMYTNDIRKSTSLDELIELLEHAEPEAQSFTKAIKFLEDNGIKKATTFRREMFLAQLCRNFMFYPDGLYEIRLKKADKERLHPKHPEEVKPSIKSKRTKPTANEPAEETERETKKPKSSTPLWILEEIDRRYRGKDKTIEDCFQLMLFIEKNLGKKPKNTDYDQFLFKIPDFVCEPQNFSPGSKRLKFPAPLRNIVLTPTIKDKIEDAIKRAEEKRPVNEASETDMDLVAVTDALQEAEDAEKEKNERMVYIIRKPETRKVKRIQASEPRNDDDQIYDHRDNGEEEMVQVDEKKGNPLEGYHDNNKSDTHSQDTEVEDWSNHSEVLAVGHGGTGRKRPIDESERSAWRGPKRRRLQVRVPSPARLTPGAGLSSHTIRRNEKEEALQAAFEAHDRGELSPGLMDHILKHVKTSKGLPDDPERRKVIRAAVACLSATEPVAQDEDMADANSEPSAS